MAGPEVPHVPYGGTDPPSPGGTPPAWLRRLLEDPAPPSSEGAGAALLAEPPRAVPLAYRLAALSLSAWGLFTVMIIVLSPMALWITYPLARTVALVVGTPVLVATRLRRYRHRVGILRWGKVATVTASNQGTSGSSFTNWPMRQASGWDVSTVLFSGSGTKTDVSYVVDNQPGTLTVRGMPYVDGVILADSRHPERAMVVSQFPHSVKPGIDGRFVGRLAPARWAWSVVTLVLVAVLVALTVWSVVDLLGG